MGKAKKNKQVFLRPHFWKTDEADRFLFFISPQKQMRPLFFSSKTNDTPFFGSF